MSNWTCQCNGTGWVCEAHHTTPWRNGDGCCGAPGMPCSQCNTGHPPTYPPDTYPIGSDSDPRIVAPMRPLEPLQVVTDPSVPMDEIEFRFDDGRAERVKLPATNVDPNSALGKAMLSPSYMDFRDPVAQLRAGDKITYEAISRSMFRASARLGWGQTVTDEELQAEALDDLYHELGIKREDR